jgi:DNA polymerase-1
VIKIPYYTPEPLTPRALEVVREVKGRVYGDDVRVRLVDAPAPGPGVLSMDSLQIGDYPLAGMLLERRMLALSDHLWGEKTLYLDTETQNAGKQWGMTPREFFRLGQYAWGSGDVVITTDYDEIIDVVRSADGVVAHNLHPFDASTLFGTDSTEPLEMARDGKMFDTMVHASLVLPAPSRYVNRFGAVVGDAAKPGKALGWLSLDNLCYQLGLAGKIGSLTALARKYNPEGTAKDDLDYGLIPLDDPDFLAYAEGDVLALRELTSALVRIERPTEYHWREQVNAAIDAQNTRNGFTVDIAAAKTRHNELQVRREDLLTTLQTEYNFPTEGKAPWSSAVGRKAILQILADNGLVPSEIPDWPKGKTGPSLGGKILIEFTEGTEVEELARSLAELMGQRTLPQLAMDSVQADGKAHPDITALQRSGRKSTTKPGLTIWGSRTEELAKDKAYFTASPGCKLVEFDYSQADARMVAAYSGDLGFLQRFAEGVDAHELTGRVVFGDEEYDADPKRLRHVAKTLGHAYAYRASAGKLAKSAKQPLEVAQKFVDGMNKAYPDVIRWQQEVEREGREGWVTNQWGRKMIVDRGRAYTQAPALYGQSGTRELMVDALIRMLYADIRLITWLVVQVHDALVFDIPEEHLEWAVPMIKDCMETNWGTKQIVHFAVEHGHPADNWMEAGH